MLEIVWPLALRPVDAERVIEAAVLADQHDDVLDRALGLELGGGILRRLLLLGGVLDGVGDAGGGQGHRHTVRCKLAFFPDTDVQAHAILLDLMCESTTERGMMRSGDDDAVIAQCRS